MRTMDTNEIDSNLAVKYVKVTEEFAVDKNVKVVAEHDASTNAKVSEENATSENNDKMDELAVTLSNMTVHPDEFKALDMDKTFQMMAAYPCGEELQRQAESQEQKQEPWANKNRVGRME